MHLAYGMSFNPPHHPVVSLSFSFSTDEETEVWKESMTFPWSQLISSWSGFKCHPEPLLHQLTLRSYTPLLTGILFLLGTRMRRDLSSCICPLGCPPTRNSPHFGLQPTTCKSFQTTPELPSQRCQGLPYPTQGSP